MNKTQAKKQLAKKINLKRMSKAKARVEIAKDVLAQLALKKIEAHHGSYVYIERPLVPSDQPWCDLTGELRQLHAQSQLCDVCALGAAFLVEVDRNNDCEVEVGVRTDFQEVYTWLPGHLAVERLQRYFSSKQLALIEYAFDQANIADDLDNVEAAIAYAFARKFEGRTGNKPEKLLPAIMKNIIKHDGTFKPEADLSKRAVAKIRQEAVRESDNYDD